MAHLSTEMGVIAPTSRDGGRDIEMSRHERVHFSCRHISFGRIIALPLAGEHPFPRQHHNENRQHIIFAPLTSTLVALRPQTPPNIDRDYLCNRHMKRFRLYRTQWIETEAVNPIHTILRKFHPRHGSAPMLDRTVYPAASGHCNIEEHYWSKG